MTRFVAYVYPGWHRDDFRPDVDEWQLLYDGQSRHDEASTPRRPVDGPYDDTSPSTAHRFLDLAADYGIAAYAYFSYVDHGQDVFAAPYAVMRSALAERPGVQVLEVWCARLPHTSFPVGVVPPVGDDSWVAAADRDSTVSVDHPWREEDLRRTPVSQLREELGRLSR